MKMTTAEGRNFKNCEYRFLVYYSIIKRLNELLQQNSNRLKLEEICLRFEAEYNQNLIFFITRENEIVLEPSSKDGPTNEILEEKMPPGWNGLEESIKNIDFTNVLHQDVKKICERVISAEEIENYETVHFNCVFSNDGENNKVQNLKIFEKYVGNNDITNFFDKISWKTNTFYTGIVCHIYDPSKFWMRFAEVDLLQKHLWEFYNQKTKEYLVSSTDICIGLNCAVLISDLFYRGKIVRTEIRDINSYILFLYDYGMNCRVHRQNLFRLHAKFAVIPAFAVRCTLSNVSPLDNVSWTQDAANLFYQLTDDNKKLIVRVSHVKLKRKILEVYLADSKMRSEDKMPTINHLLVKENLAKISWEEPVESSETGAFRSLTKYTYLYPTHEMIENGIAPYELYHTNQLKKYVSWDVLFPDLYAYHR